MRVAIPSPTQAYRRCYCISYVVLGGVLIWANFLVGPALVVTSGRALA